MKDSGFKVFCTFRPNLINVGDQVDVSMVYSIHAHDEDIRNYLSIRLEEEWIHDECFIPQIVDQLAEGAKGKYVSLVFI